MKKITDSLEATYDLAAAVSKSLTGGEVILLNGDLGAGKTTFTKGLALALGITKTVTSPTFTIMKSYQGAAFTLNHFDMYRISEAEELEELGLSDLMYDDKAISVIEWNKFTELPKKVIVINITKIDANSRKFEIEVK